MDDAIHAGDRGLRRLPGTHVSPHPFDRTRKRARPQAISQPSDVQRSDNMVMIQQLDDDAAADRAGSTGDEYLHLKIVKVRTSEA